MRDLIPGQIYTLEELEEMFPDSVIIDNSEGVIYNGRDDDAE